MRKQDRAELFRVRLMSAMRDAGLTQTELSQKAGIDRSTISQLLKPQETRMPNGHVLAELAAALGVSSDWLLGLSHERGAVAGLLEQVVQMADAPRHPADDHLMRWYREAAGYKVRHVPSNLPDLLKTDAVFEAEYGISAERTARQAVADAAAKLDYIRQPGTDIEIAYSRQVLVDFANGHGMWSDLSAEVRRRQLDRMARLAEELYPSLRVYLFDALSHFAAPYTIFGPKRAAIYLGQGYLTFSSVAHIRIFIRHFDSLVRAAVVQADAHAAFVRSLPVPET